MPSIATATATVVLGVPVAADAAGTTGLFTALVLDAAGHPVVTYHDFTNGDLKVLRCGDPACTANNTITTPDAAGDVGHWTSLALDSAGRPVIAYQDVTNTAVKVLRCGDAACTSGNTIVNFPGSPGLLGQVMPVRITDAAPNSLRGELEPGGSPHAH